jgi:hypothetical protein
MITPHPQFDSEAGGTNQTGNHWISAYWDKRDDCESAAVLPLVTLSGHLASLEI